jgi:hypothetical protein
MATSVTPLADINKAVPFRGGCNTAIEPDLLPFGAYSMVQNMRGLHPGMMQRKGCRKQHTTADGSNEVLTLFQFSKGKTTERHLYAQMGDGDVLDATTEPPGITTGAFGTEVFSGSTGQIPASWSVINDHLLYSNGVDQHQVSPGTDPHIEQIIIYKGTETIPNIPTMGEDYTEQATDGLTTTVVALDSLATLETDYDCIFVRTLLPATSIKFVVSAANGSAAVAAANYWNGAWTALSGFTDGTAVTGATLAQNGSMSWTAPADEIPHYMFNECGFWYQIYLSSGALDAEVEVSSIYYNTAWQPLQNVWDGIPIDITEAQYYDASLTSYATYGCVNIDVGLMQTDDKINIACATNICGFYVDVGATPNTTASTTISDVKFWNGAALASVTGLVDGTAGLSHSGWVTFNRPTTGQPRQFQNTGYYAHWFEITVDKALSAGILIGIQVMPFFDLAEFGTAGLVNIAWKDRALYVWDRFPVDICVSAKSRPLTLNGSDFCYLERPGDGRLNKVVAWKKFYNDLMVWQEELGTNGGCLTIYEGYSPDTFGKFVVSTRYGSFNAKSAIVVEGIRLGENKVEDRPICIAFFLSHAGVCMSDGRSVVIISQDIANYFDPTKDECIRNGYEHKMWLAHDATYNVLRIGLVSGSTATECNIFPVYDLTDKCWYFDSLAQPFACVTDIQAGSGNVTVLQMAGGCADGYVYQTNYGDDDVTTTIDSYITMELDGSGALLDLRELIVRIKSGQGNLTVTPVVDGVEQTAKTIP